MESNVVDIAKSTFSNKNWADNKVHMKRRIELTILSVLNSEEMFRNCTKPMPPKRDNWEFRCTKRNPVKQWRGSVEYVNKRKTPYKLKNLRDIKREVHTIEAGKPVKRYRLKSVPVCVQKMEDFKGKTPGNSEILITAECRSLNSSRTTKPDLNIMSCKDALACFVKELEEVEAAVDLDVINCLELDLVDAFHRVSFCLCFLI
jgi:Holliday junction resolvase RusA-like endonuclease